MLVNVDNIAPYERQLLLIFKMAMENSHELTPQQKTRIESKLQEIVDIWNEGSKK